MALGLKVPAGTVGHQPALDLSYDGGGGNGPLGYGWTLSLPQIQRRSDKGIPTYGEDLGVDRPDVFINEQREELVPGTDGYFRCANESTFVRYRPVGDHWEGTAPNGTRLEFGLTASGRIEESVTGRVFAWLLERETDTRGNIDRVWVSLVRRGGQPQPEIPVDDPLRAGRTARGRIIILWRLNMRIGRTGLRMAGRGSWCGRGSV